MISALKCPKESHSPESRDSVFEEYDRVLDSMEVCWDVEELYSLLNQASECSRKVSYSMRCGERHFYSFDRNLTRIVERMKFASELRKGVIVYDPRPESHVEWQ